jgi:hypothetical protein
LRGKPCFDSDFDSDSDFDLDLDSDLDSDSDFDLDLDSDLDSGLAFKFVFIRVNSWLILIFLLIRVIRGPLLSLIRG